MTGEGLAAKIQDRQQCRQSPPIEAGFVVPRGGPLHEVVAVARTHGRSGRPWERLARQTIGLWVSQGKPCPRCGKGIDPPGTWPARHPQSPSVDHIVPLSVDRSRAHDPRNLRVLHYGCNAARGDGSRDTVKRAW